jgi:hypothetical protein
MAAPEPLRAYAVDGVTVLRATWAVASSPAMPRHGEYMAWYRAQRRRATRLNPPAAELGERQQRLARTSERAARTSLPWCATAPPLRRTFPALVSFVDDYAGPYPRELFPAGEVARLLDRLRAAAAPATLDEQLAAALEITGGRLFAAAVLLHAATRWLARARDTRALGPLPWSQRLDDAALLAPFAPAVEADGDAPGDTYHYWANFVAGCQTFLDGGVAARAMRTLFVAGPVAMSAIRGGLFGRTLFAGNHAAVDRLGLMHGEAAARALVAA